MAAASALAVAPLRFSTVPERGNWAGREGGGISNLFGTSTVNNSTISGNSATDGGGIYNLFGNTVNNSTISGNSAGLDGGGIYNTQGGTSTVNSTRAR
ncbi:MAG: hypothetical protein DSM106950_41490 [Stigonema ocellatum SAG 48.90 = DSM 106950]|nr:hypothetical protein [Stigonema ocellatum SAG 48.90 = DSM 106950]